LPQDVPSARLLHADVLAPGWQVWQGLLPFASPDATIVPPMSHSVPQLPDTQISPLPHAIPSGSLVHVVVLSAGVQISQPVLAVEPGAVKTPPM